MQKTKLGISVGLLGAIVCFAAFFSGYLAAIVLMGYILLFESNEWLRKIAVKAVVILVAFSVLDAVVGLIPDAIDLIDSLFGIFGKSFSIGFLSSLVSLVRNALDILEKLIFLVLGFKALSQGSVAVGPIDGIVDKNLSVDEQK